MAVIGMRDVCWGFGDPPLLEKVTFQIAKGERVCLLGRNGAGKSTLLKLLAGEILSDSGDVWRQQRATVAVLEQDVSLKFDGTIFDVIAEGLGQEGRTLAEYNRTCIQLETATSPKLVKKQVGLQNMLNSGSGWELLRQVESVVSKTRLDPEKIFADLSAGMKRRTLFARALAGQPDIFLLDEPTNHLDIDSIVWMEEFILRNIPTLLFITHDRAFLRKIANRIMELDRGSLVSYNSDYETYLKRREADLKSEENQNRVFDRKLSGEEIWIRQGIKARRTRNEGRVRALKKMRAAFLARRRQSGNVKMQVQEAERTGKLVVEAKNVNFLYGATPVIRDFTTVIMRGDKVGIIGSNGVGKTTLLQILLKEISPDSGCIRHGTNLQVAYFDQLRARLDTYKTVQENIGEGNDFIIFNDQKRHVISYLQDFLFSPERCRTPVRVLSGGEKNRLLLAKLFARPANVLVMDEPTNDLDAETLELLETLLFDYSGTLLLVSHDRTFLNNVVTSTLVFEGQGRVIEYAGGYDDWLIQRPQPEQERLSAKKSCNKPGTETRRLKVRKLSFIEKLELKELPLKIDAFETEQKELYVAMSDPMFYKKRKEEITRIQIHLVKLEDAIAAAYLRWEVLENIEKD